MLEQIYKQKNIEYFNKVADKWDNMIYHNPQKLKYFFDALFIKKGETVLDVGTGTGILIPYIIERIGKSGKLFAIDISSRMIQIASTRYRYPNLVFIIDDVEDHCFGEILFDKIICYSVFPHFSNHQKVIKKFYTLLSPNGILAIFHSASREYINNIHRENGFHLEKNMLPPAIDVSSIMTSTGFFVTKCIDNDNMFLIIGKKIKNI